MKENKKKIFIKTFGPSARPETRQRPCSGPKVFVKTFGCQMNVRDSEFVLGVMLDAGYREAGSIEEADVIIFNSCSVRKHAEDRLFSNIGELKHLKKKHPKLVMGLMGCTAQLYGEKALERSPLLDFVCGPGNETEIPSMVREIMAKRLPLVAVDKVHEKRPELKPAHRADQFKTQVSIMEGCDNYCSYCVVPYVRGRERSRNPYDIIAEIGDLAARGFKEVTLLGQNVNSYVGNTRSRSGNPGDAFIRLLEMANGIEGIERIRFMTSHPKDASAELFTAMRDLPKVCEHLHLPLQSGSDRILKLMNRKYTSSQYLKLIDAYRRIVPDGALTTDFIVGFPSETAEDHARTIALVRKARFDSAYIFHYSPRPPAKASTLPDDVPAADKVKRFKELMDLQTVISTEGNRRWQGQTLEVLVDGPSGKKRGIMAGRSRSNKVVVFPGSAKLVGATVRVRIDETAAYTLKGAIVA